MTRELGIGVIGAGRIGTVHAHTIAGVVSDARLAWIADPAEQARTRLGQSVGCEQLTDVPETLFNDSEVDAVVICSSTDTHAELITKAAQAGKHIFCEKPLALSVEDIDAALAEVDKAGVALQVGFNRRFDRDFSAIRKQILDGTIGRPETLRITSRDPRPPPIDYVRVSGGMFLDMTIHDFDMARYLMGSEITEVHVYADALVDPAIGEAGDVDTAVISLRFASGAVGVIENSRRTAYGYDQRVEVFGSEGMLHNLNQRTDDVVVTAAEGSCERPLMDFFMDRYKASYQLELQAFVDAVRESKPTPVGGEDGRVAVVLGHAATRSWRDGLAVKTA